MHVRITAKTGWAGLLLSAALVLPGCGSVPAGQPAGTTSEPAPTAGASTGSSPSTSAEPAATKPVTTSPATKTSSASTKTSSSKAALVLAKGAKGEKVRELQVRLRDLDWYTGTITGTYGSSTVAAVKGFQGRRELKKTGDVDATTWAQLTKRTTTPTRDERHNVLRAGPALYKQGSSGDKVRELQARLKQIAWFSGSVTGAYGSATASGVRGFQDKRAIPETG